MKIRNYWTFWTNWKCHFGRTVAPNAVISLKALNYFFPQFVSKAEDGRLEVYSDDNDRMEEFDFLICSGLLPEFLRKSDFIDKTGKYLIACPNFSIPPKIVAEPKKKKS